MQIDVELDQQHLENLSAATPLTGVIELIWNALDADSTEVKVEFGRGAFDGVEDIRVIDNGHGMTLGEAAETFGKLGGSWKNGAPGSRGQGRALHGRDGKGRFRAAGIGNRMTWKTVAADPENEGRRLALSIVLEMARLAHVEISDPEETQEPTGTTVLIEQIVEPPAGLGGETPVDKLTGTFGLYLQNYNAHLKYDGDEIDPEKLQAHRAEYPIPFVDADDALLTVIEWNRKVDRGLFHRATLSVERLVAELARYGQLYRARDKGSTDPLWRAYYPRFPSVVCPWPVPRGRHSVVGSTSRSYCSPSIRLSIAPTG
jgi:Histidine kinase-, DNA gyrase B-, and HSP90-like ATPase